MVDFDKFPHKRYNIRTVDESGKPAKPSKPYSKRDAEAYVCLTCTKKKCSGTKECFEKRKEAHEG